MKIRSLNLRFSTPPSYPFTYPTNWLHRVKKQLLISRGSSPLSKLSTTQSNFSHYFIDKLFNKVKKNYLVTTQYFYSKITVIFLCMCLLWPIDKISCFFFYVSLLDFLSVETNYVYCGNSIYSFTAYLLTKKSV